MSTIDIIRTLLHGIDFYWKKFIVFLLFIGVATGGFFIWRSESQPQASLQFADAPQYAVENEKDVEIRIFENGKVTVNGKNDSKALSIFPEYYEVRLLVLDNPGVVINHVSVKMELPKPVDENQVEQIIYAVHGVSSYNYYIASPTTLVYEADYISTMATLTVAARFPKDILTPPLGKKIVYNITNVPAKEYVFIALAIPLGTLIVMLFMIVKRRKDQILALGADPIPFLPNEKIPPAVAGVLIDAQVGAREVAATLIDLACRGFIYITKNRGNFSFGIRKSLNVEELDIRPFEKILLSKIFENLDYRSTKEDVEMRVGRHIFSRKIAKSYLEIYNEATNLGYFVKNPAQIHKRWLSAGITLFFLSLLGYAHSAFFAPDPKFTLIFWAGGMLAASVVIKLAGLMPVRSDYGSSELGKWMAFRNYLKLKDPIEPGANNKGKYSQYLPYAIVFGVEAEWTKRFFDEPFTKPSWYESDEPISTLENFSGGLFTIISFVGKLLDRSREPGT